MEAVFALLKRIQLDYGVYIGSKSIHKLAVFLSGYECALSDISDVKPRFNSAFQRFVEQKEGYKGSKHWADILFENASEELAFDRFFALIEEFRSWLEQE